jgi:hypothetical protein
MTGKFKPQVTDFSAGHWKLVPGPDGELCVEPYGYYAAGWFAIVCMGAVILAVCFWPELNLERGIRVIFGFMGSIVTVIVSSFFFWMHRYEQRLGPYLVITPETIRLRQGRSVPREEFSSFEINRQWENLGDGKQKVSRLVLRCKSGEEIEFIASAFHRQVVKLKQALDEHVGQAV